MLCTEVCCHQKAEEARTLSSHAFIACSWPVPARAQPFSARGGASLRAVANSPPYRSPHLILRHTIQTRFVLSSPLRLAALVMAMMIPSRGTGHSTNTNTIGSNRGHTPTISLLPDELIIHIFCYLDVPDLLAASRVSSRQLRSAPRFTKH